MAVNHEPDPVRAATAESPSVVDVGLSVAGDSGVVPLVLLPVRVVVPLVVLPVSVVVSVSVLLVETTVRLIVEVVVSWVAESPRTIAKPEVAVTISNINTTYYLLTTKICRLIQTIAKL